jgi:hypothetical protein
MQNKLIEGLRPLDLKEMIRPVFEVDTFRSKMGEDQDVCVVSFTVKDRFPAKDLMEFVEKGYNFVLDADVSSGENNDGEYSVFIELERSSKLSEQIKELTYGIRKLTGIDGWQFKYHKNNAVHEATEENLKNHIPSSPRMYEEAMTRIKTENVRKFFTKTLMDDLTLDGNVITIHKPYNQKIQLRWLNEDDPQPVIEGAMDIDEAATAEMFWLTKVLGDYNISKFGDKFLFTNGGGAMLLQRIEQ